MASTRGATSTRAFRLRPWVALPPVPGTKGEAVVEKLLEVLPEREQRAVLAWDKGITKAREERAVAEPQK